MIDDGEVRLFRQVLGMALQEDNALQWLASDDGQLVCALAGVEPEAAERALKGRRDRC